MKNRSLIHLSAVLVVLFTSFSGVCAQSRTEVGGLSDNAEYAELIARERLLRSKDDSLSGVLDGLRTELRDNPQSRSRYGSKILELESSLFDTRNQVGAVAGRISVIEQDYVLKSLEAGVTPDMGSGRGQLSPADRTGGVPDLVKNRYFKSNLRAEDYALLLDAQSAEGELMGFLGRYKSNYMLLTAIESHYPREKDKGKADSIYTVYTQISELNARIADSVDARWMFVNDNKIYVYSYLLEKMGRADVLSQIQTAVAQEGNVEAENSGKYSSDGVAFYTLRKSLLLDIELRISELAGLDKSRDSLSAVRSKVNATSYAFEPIDLQEKLFIDFVPVSVAQGKYHARSPIPKMEERKNGTIYRIQIGTFQKLTAISVFRNLYPLVYNVGQDGRYRYYAGCYESAAEAAQGLALVKRVGFKDAFIVLWESGVLHSAADSPSVAAATKDKSGGRGVLFRIEIKTGGKALPAAAHDLISNSGKELTKVGGTIIVGLFEQQSAADKLASELVGLGSQLEVIVTPVGG